METSQDLAKMVTQRIEEGIGVKRELLKHIDAIAAVGKLLLDTYRRGGKAIFFGNGGSAADAQHLAAEMLGRYYIDRRPLPSLALNVNTSTLTAIGNDYSYDTIFSRQLEGLGNAGDVAVGLTTSGNSKNVIEAMRVAKRKNIATVVLTGATGGQVKDQVDHCICVPSKDTPRIQECHILVGHIWCEIIEKGMFS